MDKTEHTLVTVGILGAFIGIGKLLAAGDPITPRQAVGHAIVSSGIAMSAGAVLAWIPDASTTVVIGVSCALASLGTSGLSLFLQRFFNVRSDKDPN